MDGCSRSYFQAAVDDEILAKIMLNSGTEGKKRIKSGIQQGKNMEGSIGRNGRIWVSQ
jgi:hypothetical protein